MSYDSSIDTLMHRQKVQALLSQFIGALAYRGRWHDQSKLLAPEKEVWDRVTPQLYGITYGSREYQKILGNMKEAVRHHYQHNPHHPEFFEDPPGLEGMTLIDVVEMFCDWIAASERHADGNPAKSIDLASHHHGLSPQLTTIFQNTLRAMREHTAMEYEAETVDL